VLSPVFLEQRPQHLVDVFAGTAGGTANSPDYGFLWWLNSKGGKPIIALPSTAKNGAISRIVPELTSGAGVVTSRGLIRYVVTEFGVAYLYGKSIRERAKALIEIAHPMFRAQLTEECERKKWFRHAE